MKWWNDVGVEVNNVCSRLCFLFSPFFCIPLAGDLDHGVSYDLWTIQCLIVLEWNSMASAPHLHGICTSPLSSTLQLLLHATGMLKLLVTSTSHFLYPTVTNLTFIMRITITQIRLFFFSFFAIGVAVVKQRMQVFGSGYRTCMQCGRSILRKEGMWAFYRSYTTQLVMNVPFQSIQFVMYEVMQDFLNNDRSYSPGTHMCSGAVAGAVAAAVTMPLDVCKTLLNTQENCARTHLSYINGMASAFRTVYEFRGIYGFLRGMGARVIYQMPSTAISWSVYEFFKFVMTQRNHSDDGGYLTAQVPVSNVNGVNVHAASAASLR